MKPTRLLLEYRGSAADPGEYPAWDLPEIAVSGRSNAGKSSLLNRLAGRRDLARVSKTPGRTQRLHFFVEHAARFAIVDLPGYGFARISKRERARLAAAADRYLREREQLCALVLIVDVRRDLRAEERMLVEFAAARGLRVLRVATKVDKLGRGERARRLRDLEEAAQAPWLPFSAVTGEGCDSLAAAVASLPTAQMENRSKV